MVELTLKADSDFFGCFRILTFFLGLRLIHRDESIFGVKKSICHVPNRIEKASIEAIYENWERRKDKRNFKERKGRKQEGKREERKNDRKLKDSKKNQK